MENSMVTKTLKELAELVGGEASGDLNTIITGAADISDAVEGDIVFAESPKLMVEAEKSAASAIITSFGIPGDSKPVIRVQNPRYAFARVLEAFSPVAEREIGIHPSAYVGQNVTIGERVSVGFNAYIGNDVVLGNDVTIRPFAYVGNSVNIGDGCTIHPFVSIYDGVTIGNRVIIHSGSVIGADGFGYTRVGDTHYKIPQIGTVIICDDVEIGANVTIDRARTGKTEIGRGTKIDNLVQIGHNCSIGENCIIVAQVGLSGSITVGNRVILAGQAGLKDHITIGDDAIICARSGVIGDIPPGAFVSGYPARSHKEQLRIAAATQKLPELAKLVQELEKRIKALEEQSK
ncbi:MAG: UDP-3-O-(3-hydroxymyristoyl)glucosamine N-acyltransferase [Armatimonadota bacterium]|nr:UDP-3-O-(3-hydroxymyristoyl)glucosamine N-acyltransferase [Armatimonadota bacterium]